jgi:predicted Zn-dependent protease
MKKGSITRRRIWFVSTALGVVALGTLCGWPVWQRRQLDLRVSRAVAALAQPNAPPIDAVLLSSLEGNPRYGGELQLFRGTQLLRSGQPALALQAYAQVNQEGSLRLPLLLHVGQALYQTGQLTQAEHVFRQIEFENPRVSAAHRSLATIYHDLGAMRSAYVELEKVVELEPDDFFAYRLMGQMDLDDFQSHKKAVVEYRQALARNPPPAQVQAIRTEMARALLFLNDYAGVLEVLEGTKKNALALALQAECRWSMSETQEALRLLEEARLLNPDERMVLYLLGRFALEDGRPQAALGPLQTLLDRDPHDTQARYQLSQAYRQLGDQAAAVAELDRMNESKALAEKIGPLYDQAIFRPQDSEIRDKLADLCDKLGRPELARVWRRAASQLRQSGGISGPVR